MAQSGYTPILLYASGTTGNTPSAGDLTSGAAGAELAINYFDGKLFYKDNAGVVQVLATKATGTVGGSTTQVQYNNAGVLAGSANFVFSGTGVGIGGAVATPSRLYVAGTHPSSGAQTQVVRVGGTLSSSTTGAAASFLSRPVTEAASYTLSDLIHFWAHPDTFGAGSTVTNQFGFYADNTLTAAKYNYGYYSAIQGKAPLNISAINGNGSTVTVDTASAHGLSNGDLILIARVPVSTMTANDYNGGPYTVTVVDSDTFTFSSGATSSAPVTSGQIVYVDRWAFYGVGTASSYFGGNVGIGALPTNRLDLVQSNSGSSVIVRIANSGSPTTNNTSLISFDTINGGVGVRDAQIYAVNAGGTAISMVFATPNGAPPAERMRITPAGNVGINTTSPSAKLDVFGGGWFQADDSDAEIQIRRASGNTGGSLLYLNKSRGTTASRVVVNSGDTLGTTLWRGWDGSTFVNAAAISVEVDGTPGASDMPGRMIFSTTADGASSTSERMRITSAGNVGIGTSSPSGLLHLYTTASFQPQLIVENENSGASGGYFILDKGRSNAAATANDTLGTLLWRARDSNGTLQNSSSIYATAVAVSAGAVTSYMTLLSSHDLLFAAGNAEAMRITAAGRVGIGTSSPSQALQVVGSAVVSGTMFMSDDQRVQWGTSSSAYIVGKQGGSGTGLVKIGASGDIVYITAAGNVGINEAAPDYMLDVNGSFGFTPGSSVTPVDNGDVVIEATNNTTLTFKLKGSDGTVRTGTITLS